MPRRLALPACRLVKHCGLRSGFLLSVSRSCDQDSALGVMTTSYSLLFDLQFIKLGYLALLVPSDI